MYEFLVKVLFQKYHNIETLFPINSEFRLYFYFILAHGKVQFPVTVGNHISFMAFSVPGCARTSKE